MAWMEAAMAIQMMMRMKMMMTEERRGCSEKLKTETLIPFDCAQVVGGSGSFYVAGGSEADDRAAVPPVHPLQHPSPGEADDRAAVPPVHPLQHPSPGEPGRRCLCSTASPAST